MANSQWIAHVYYPDNDVKEITFLSPAGMKKQALDWVVDYLKIEGPNDPQIRGLVITEDRPGGWTATLGNELKKEKRKQQEAQQEERKVPKAPDNVVELRPQRTWNRYEVKVFITPSQMTPTTTWVSAPTAREALQGILSRYGFETLNRVGDYLVWQIKGGVKILRLRKGFFTSAEALVPEPAPPAINHSAQPTPINIPRDNKPVYCCEDVVGCKERGTCKATGATMRVRTPEATPPPPPASKPAPTRALPYESTVRGPAITLISGIKEQADATESH